MKAERVLVTGLGAVSPYGPGVEPMWGGLSRGECPLGPLPGAEKIPALGARAAGLVPELDARVIPRTHRRAMSRLGLFACLAAREALDSAGLAGHWPKNTGLALGTTMGSPETMTEFFGQYLGSGDLGQVRGPTFFKIMGHGAASALGQYLGLEGRVLAPAAACAAGLQAVGLAYEAISAGREEIMLCGGAEEFDILTALTFDQILAASRNPEPATASRPFDRRRDGLVCSEGAGILLLESESRARKRGARVWAEIAGFGLSASPGNLVHPEVDGLSRAMRAALRDSGLEPGQITAVNAHATATVEGDRAEGLAILGLLGTETPVNSLKSLLGHSMAASGALELIASIRMMNEDIFLPNHNFERPDDDLSGLSLSKKPQKRIIAALLKNSFALGGVNASVVVKKYN